MRVTGTLNGAPKQYETVVRVTVTTDTADPDDFNAVSPFDLTIAAGRERGTEDFTLTPVNDLMDEPPETVTVDGSATVRDGSSIVERLDVNGTTVTIEDNDDPPTLTLELSADSITESGVDNRTTVRAVLNHPSSEVTTVDVSAAAVPPAVAADFTLSGTSLTILAGETESRGSATLTARNNAEDEADKQVTVRGRAENAQGVQSMNVRPVTVTITDDDPPEVEGEPAPAYVEGGTGPVATYTASNPDPRNISIRWGLEGADKDAFTISNGVLRFTASPDYEDPNNLDNEYAVTVQATASDEPLPGAPGCDRHDRGCPRHGPSVIESAPVWERTHREGERPGRGGHGHHRVVLGAITLTSLPSDRYGQDRLRFHPDHDGDLYAGGR